ncbi:unnamed protein product, partial [Phaeothamnion confervicola]
TIKNFRDLTTAFHSSPQLTKDLQDACRLAGIVYRTIQRDAATCWWSTWQMHDRPLPLRPGVDMLEAKGRLLKVTDKNFDLAPEPDKWEIAEQIEEALRDF